MQTRYDNMIFFILYYLQQFKFKKNTDFLIVDNVLLQLLNEITSAQSSHTCSETDSANLPENEAKNRSPEILPCKYT